MSSRYSGISSRGPPATGDRYSQSQYNGAKRDSQVASTSSRLPSRYSSEVGTSDQWKVAETEKELEKELRKLKELRGHALAQRSAESQEGKKRVPVVGHKNFCPKFVDCPHVHEESHRMMLMHACHLSENCPELRSVSHCLSYWHILPVCLRDHHDKTCTGKFRHICEAGVTCPEVSNPVHQQLFEHSRDPAVASSTWLHRQRNRPTQYNNIKNKRLHSEEVTEKHYIKFPLVPYPD